MDETLERRVLIADNARARELFGLNDSHLRHIEESFNVLLVPRGNEVIVKGPEAEVGRVMRLFERLTAIQDRGGRVTERDVRYAVRLASEGDEKPLAEAFTDVIVTTYRGKQIRPKTLGQKEYVDAIRRSGVTFGIGPAGTGKTYLAMAVAVAAFKAKEVARIILTRPAVEAGEKLGFLPGDMQQKVDPYLRPLYDALFDIMGSETYERLLDRGVIEVAPLAFMRGRTLDDSFIILDEAQNTTPEQMKMFLTRMGFGSRIVVTGDVTQIDLPEGTRSGLVEVQRILRNVPGISFYYLTERDVVRNDLVQLIIKAYEAAGGGGTGLLPPRPRAGQPGGAET
ncbi:phosphate starvation-inducible PhoH-like protein [Symbiobacterium terraclitae]|uniref:PhoH-like protein n=1 Tax=Symbiobacterium terraclitae TaxID=557451 RepID=A0ABS4JP84_9FIRM|nr:PhoH family protein [Symbiobacterium terraclitae]MBP2017330.1 phosphate starvation-inducible PhoH-like protein [Symbiobacterium terraclitae]